MARHPNPLIVSLGLFTVIPMPSVAAIDRRLATRAMAAFPLVGVVVGLLGAVVTGVAAWLGGPFLGAALGLGTLAALTGALHLDGVADTADGLGSRKPQEQALEIMRRSDIGPMGVISLLFVLLVDIAAIIRLAAEAPLAGPLAVLVAAVLGRVAVLLATTPSNVGARLNGFGALFHGVTSRTTAALWCVAGVVIAGLAGLTAGVMGAVVLGIAAVLALGISLLWRNHLARRLGGMTGDVFGSIVEVTQMVFLVLAALGIGAMGQLSAQ